MTDRGNTDTNLHDLRNNQHRTFTQRPLSIFGRFYDPWETGTSSSPLDTTKSNAVQIGVMLFKVYSTITLGQAYVQPFFYPPTLNLPTQLTGSQPNI